MDRAQVLEKVKAVAVNKLLVNPEEVVESANIKDDLGADSLDAVDLIIGFEEEFGIQIPDEDAVKIQTVKEAVDYIAEKTAV